jgi:hypothetical protein
MVLISKSFLQSTRPSLQTRRHPPAPADKSRKGRAKTPLTRPSLQTAPHPASRLAAVAPQGDCARSTGDASADTRANSRDGVEPRRAAPAPGSRGSQHRSAAWPVANIAGAHADRPVRCSTSDSGLVNAAGTPRCRPHTAASPSPLSAQENLSEEHPAFLASNPRPGALTVIAAAESAPRALHKSDRSTRTTCAWVHSREHSRVNSDERQGESAAQSSKAGL